MSWQINVLSLNLFVVVVLLVLVTLAAAAFLLYRYFCHNKGAYRTTGEPAPGEDPDQVYNDTVAPIKKEYYIWGSKFGLNVPTH